MHDKRGGLRCVRGLPGVQPSIGKNALDDALINDSSIEAWDFPFSVNGIGDVLEHLRAEYEAVTQFPLAICGADGSIRSGEPVRTMCSCASACPERRRQAALETLHWGETVINLCCEDGFALWAVPILGNQKLVGALVTQGQNT